MRETGEKEDANTRTDYFEKRLDECSLNMICRMYMHCTSSCFNYKQKYKQIGDMHDTLSFLSSCLELNFFMHNQKSNTIY